MEVVIQTLNFEKERLPENSKFMVVPINSPHPMRHKSSSPGVANGPPMEASGCPCYLLIETNTIRCQCANMSIVSSTKFIRDIVIPICKYDLHPKTTQTRFHVLCHQSTGIDFCTCHLAIGTTLHTFVLC